MYEASSLGRIRIRATGKVKPQWHSQRGYMRVSVRTKNKNTDVHPMVCEAFHGLCPSPVHEAAHWDGSRDNNRESNLRWATRLENAADKTRHGSQTKGEQVAMSKLTTQKVLEIRQKYAAAVAESRSRGGVRVRRGTLIALSKEYGVDPEVARRVGAGFAWKHV